VTSQEFRELPRETEGGDRVAELQSVVRSAGRKLLFFSGFRLYGQSPKKGEKQDRRTRWENNLAPRWKPVRGRKANTRANCTLHI